MSLIIATYVPEGIVMASDSRQSVTISGKTPEGGSFNVETVNSDAIIKTFLLERQKVGISNFGVDLLGGVPMASRIKAFIEEEVIEKDDAVSVAEKIAKYFRKQFPNADSGFHVAGYKREEKISVPYVFYCHVGRGVVSRKNIASEGSSQKIFYGATWSGQIDVLTSILQPSSVTRPDGTVEQLVKFPILWDTMSLQDAIDFSVYAIRTTIDTMRFQARPKNVGGPIDVLVITPDRAEFIRKKSLSVNA